MNLSHHHLLQDIMISIGSFMQDAVSYYLAVESTYWELPRDDQNVHVSDQNDMQERLPLQSTVSPEILALLKER
jgi:hypothetical protein